MKLKLLFLSLCLMMVGQVCGQVQIKKPTAAQKPAATKPKPAKAESKPAAKPKTTPAQKPANQASTKKPTQSAPVKPQSKPTPRVDTSPISDRSFTANGVSFTMICVQGGTFTMGATSEQGSDAESDEKPSHQVALSSYMIGETEVTQALWQAVMGSNPSYFKGNYRPVEQVSWNDCQTFISKLNSITGENFRMPTEAEWEYAARGGNRSRGYKYSGSDNIGNVAWYNYNSGYTTHDVKTKSPNELGIYDMSGNVWEWCSDWYGSYSSSSQTNPTGPNSGSYRVRRGGSWDINARGCRSSIRSDFTPSYSGNNIGLRLAL